MVTVTQIVVSTLCMHVLPPSRKSLSIPKVDKAKFILDPVTPSSRPLLSVAPLHVFRYTILSYK